MAVAKKSKRVRWTLLALLWVWAILVFLVIDLFMDVEEFDRVRPELEIYEATRYAAHKLVDSGYSDSDFESLAPTDAVSNLTANGAPRDGKWSAKHENGKLAVEGEYRHGRRAGIWTWYHENGTVADRESMANGLRHGDRESFHENGQASVKGAYVRGRRVGRWQEWHASGEPSREEDYHEGKRHGAFRAWHEDGQVAEEGSFVDGVPSGTWTVYSPRGRRLEQGAFRDGKRDGRWVFWDSEGKVEREEWFDETGSTRKDDYRHESHPLDSPNHAGPTLVRYE